MGDENVLDLNFAYDIPMETDPLDWAGAESFAYIAAHASLDIPPTYDIKTSDGKTKRMYRKTYEGQAQILFDYLHPTKMPDKGVPQGPYQRKRARDFLIKFVTKTQLSHIVPKNESKRYDFQLAVLTEKAGIDWGWYLDNIEDIDKDLYNVLFRYGQIYRKSFANLTDPKELMVAIGTDLFYGYLYYTEYNKQQITPPTPPEGPRPPPAQPNNVNDLPHNDLIPDTPDIKTPDDDKTDNDADNQPGSITNAKKRKRQTQLDNLIQLQEDLIGISELLEYPPVSLNQLNTELELMKRADPASDHTLRKQMVMNNQKLIRAEENKYYNFNNPAPIPPPAIIPPGQPLVPAVPPAVPPVAPPGGGRGIAPVRGRGNRGGPRGRGNRGGPRGRGARGGRGGGPFGGLNVDLDPNGQPLLPNGGQPMTVEEVKRQKRRHAYKLLHGVSPPPTPVNNNNEWVVGNQDADVNMNWADNGIDAPPSNSSSTTTSNSTSSTTSSSSSSVAPGIIPPAGRGRGRGRNDGKIIPVIHTPIEVIEGNSIKFGPPGDRTVALPFPGDNKMKPKLNDYKMALTELKKCKEEKELIREIICAGNPSVAAVKAIIGCRDQNGIVQSRLGDISDSQFETQLLHNASRTGNQT